MDHLELLLKFIERHNNDTEALRAAGAAYALANNITGYTPARPEWFVFPPENHRDLDAMKHETSMNWVGLPSAGVTFREHRLSFYHTLEVASVYLNTDHSTQLESLVAGGVICSLVMNLPTFIPFRDTPHVLPDLGGVVYRGTLGRRFVLHDRKLEVQKGWLVNGTNKVALSVTDAPR